MQGMAQEDAVALGAQFVDDLEAERERIVAELFQIAGDPRGLAALREQVQAQLSFQRERRSEIEAIVRTGAATGDQLNTIQAELEQIDLDLARLLKNAIDLDTLETAEMQEMLKLREKFLRLGYSATHTEATGLLRNAHELREQALHGAIVAAARAPLMELPGASGHPTALDGITGIALSELVTRFCRENLKSGIWKEATELDYQGDFSQFVKIVGDKQTTEISKAVVVRAKEIWLDLPANINKRADLRGKSIDEILALGLPSQSATNVAKKWDRVKTLFTWAKAHGYVAENFTDGISVKAKGTARAKFTELDLQAIFGSGEYRNAEFDEAFKYWVPMIGLFSGARLEEICQLQMPDVKEHACGYFFHFTTITDAVDGDPSHRKNLKNASSDRICPVHPKLVEMGLIDYIQDLQSKGFKRLFPELKVDGLGKVGPRASEWFTDYRRAKNVGAVNGHSTKVFHSFRHTMNAQLQRIGVAQEIREMLCGHQSKSINVAVYGGQDLDQLLVDAIIKLTYGLEFTPFKLVDKRSPNVPRA